jgi:hypothetical protein
MRKFNEMSYDEREEVVELFANWLDMYTEEVIKKVLTKADEIINNEMAMMLLKELKERDEKESRDFSRSIKHLLDDYETFAEYQVRATCLTHAKSYRDVLYDMYIK